MAKDKWDATHMPSLGGATHMPSLGGATVVITGANSGIGFVAALELARHGADVTLACRSADKGRAAESQINEALAAEGGPPQGHARFMQLDVSSLASVRAFAEAFAHTHDTLDLLINNAGIMAVPHALSVDGIESQFATNHLGHFALTARLWPLLRKSARGARVVTLASLTHWFARMKLDRVVTPPDAYEAIGVYANTKLYNLLFTRELDRRLRARGVANVAAVACHPGYSYTHLVDKPSTQSSWFMRILWGIFVRLPVGQPCEMGALPTLFAATAPAVESGEYYGPSGFLRVRGHPSLEKPRNQSDSKEAAARLWEESERLATLSFTVE